jgi:hypothetical protein
VYKTLKLRLQVKPLGEDKIYMIRKYNPYVLISSLATLSACNASPVQSVVGSYFPAWMLCAVFGIISTLIIYVIFVKINIDPFIPAKLLIYLGLAISLTLLSWLLLFGN